AAVREALGVALRVKCRRQDISLKRIGRGLAEQDPCDLAHLANRVEDLWPPASQNVQIDAGCGIGSVPLTGPTMACRSLTSRGLTSSLAHLRSPRHRYTTPPPTP